MRPKPKCPCNGCTPETGRSPDCHSDKCTHGWSDYQREYEAYREELLAARRDVAISDSVAIAFRRRTRKKNRNH